MSECTGFVHGGVITRDPGPETVCIDLANEVVMRETKFLVGALTDTAMRLDTDVWTPGDAAAFRLWVAERGEGDDFRNVSGYPVPTGDGVLHMLENAGWPNDPIVGANLPQLSAAANRAAAMDGEAFRIFPVYLETGNPRLGAAVEPTIPSDAPPPPARWGEPVLPGQDDTQTVEEAEIIAAKSRTVTAALVLFGAAAIVAVMIYRG